MNLKWQMLHLYSDFIHIALQICIAFTHSHTNSRGDHARHTPAHLEQLGVQSGSVLLKDTSTATQKEPGIEPGIFRELSVTALTSEPLHPPVTISNLKCKFLHVN